MMVSCHVVSVVGWYGGCIGNGGFVLGVQRLHLGIPVPYLASRISYLLHIRCHS